MSKDVSVYLAGPINGVILEEALEWRNEVRQILAEIGVSVYDPMAGKEKVVPSGAVINDTRNDPNHPLHYILKPDALFHRDTMNIRDSKFMLVNLNNPTGSIGTPWEMGFAYGLGKTVIVVTQDPAIVNHPFVSMSSVVFDDMEDALGFIATNLM